MVMAAFRLVRVGILSLFNWETLAIALLRLGRWLLEKKVPVWDMSTKAIYFVQWIEIGARTFGRKFANESKKTEVDDELVDSILDLSANIAEEHSFKLHQPGDIIGE